mmetsp:Transcript_24171/g.36756  ORF Transcript_24171/g.36756 Transcript_24171/m.36756 type:complete len:367 (+) Transcript_24171:174-1274(+)
MSNNKKIIVVVGATGIEGNAVVKAFDNLRANNNNNNNYEFHIRAVVPSLESSEAMDLQSVVDEMYGEVHLEKALEGEVYGVYIANDYFVDCNDEREVSLLNKIQKLIVKSSSRSSIQHVVLSCSEDTRPFVNKRNDVLFWNKMNGNMFCPPMDAKGGLADNVAGTIPTTKLYPAVLLEFFSNYMKPLERADDKGYTLKLPLERGFPLPVVAASDVGAIVCAIFQDPTRIGVTCGVTSELITPVEIAHQLSQVLGVPIAYQMCSVEEFAQSGLDGAEELANMFKYISHDAKYALRRKIPPGLKPMMGPYTQTFASWAEANVEALKAQYLGAAASSAEEGEIDKYSFVSASESQVEHVVGGTGETEWA